MLLAHAYRNLFTSRGVGNRSPLSYPLDQGKLYSSPSTSRGAGNNQFLLIHLPTPCISTYLPREGPETNHPKMHECNFEPGITIYLPREGPETDQLLVQGSLVFQLLYSSLSTSRGAGNCPLTILTKVFSTSPYSYLSTSRGDSFIREKDSKSK